MSDNLELTAAITTDEPEVAATLDDLRYLVFKGKQGDPGKAKSAYLDYDVVRLVEDDSIYTSLLMRTDINNGILPFVISPRESESSEEYFELDYQQISATSPIVHFRSKEHLLAVDSTGHFAMTDRPQGGGGGGGEGEETLLGNTPYKLTSPSSVVLRGSGATAYTVKSDTLVIADPLNGTAANATVVQENGVFKLTAGSASAWYQAYVDITMSGLTVGESYNFVFDASGCTYNEETHETVGHFILYDGGGNTLVTRGATDTNRLLSYAFTATTTSVRLRWYPATNNTFASGVSVATVKRIYINAAGTTGFSPVVDLSGSFTGEKTLRSLPAGVTINATPSCAVYAVSDDEAQKPLAGKTVVVFGDSMIGMVRDDTSATAAIAERTGATVYNVGFGGCRMSDHPSHGYAEFSMWALAKAIADNDWTAQETYASQGSDYFPEQLAVLEGIDFSEVDYAVIHYGTNDFGGGVAIGESSAASDHATLCGALRYSIETLLGAYPKLRIFVSLPCFRFWTVDGQTVYSDTYQNAQSKTLPVYVEALRAVAREYKLPVVGNYYGNGIDKVNAATYLSDGTHHTALGRERFGNFIAEQLVSGGETPLTASDVGALPDSTVIPSVPQMATAADMSDWTSGKTVDASALKADFQFALQQLDGKADTSDIPTAVSQLNNDSGYQTAAQVQTAIAAIPDELPAVTASDNGKFLRVVSGAWAAQTVPAAESNSFGGGA